MPDKPARAAEYSPDNANLARRTCLYVATRLGDLMDEIVVVGGLVPSLIIDQEHLPEGAGCHAGTMDLDLGLGLAVMDRECYRTVAERLRSAGFTPDRNPLGREIRQRWRAEGGVTVDFLIAPGPDMVAGKRLINIEMDFAAIVTPGLSFAFDDCVYVELDGQTIHGEQARRTVRVCGPGAFVVLKALAFDGRGENKDAYDLYYVLRNFGAGPRDVATRFLTLDQGPEVLKALGILQRDFTGRDSLGPVRVATFQSGGKEDSIQADVAGYVGQFLKCCGRV